MRIFFNTVLKLHTQILLILLAMITASCKKFVDIGSPTDKLTTSKVFTDSANATSAILGVYIGMASSTSPFLLHGGPSLYGGLLSDELIPINVSGDIGQFYSNAVESSNSISNNNANSTNLWNIGYLVIYRANACIEGLNHSTGISESLKNQLTGEAKFMRALAYFYLLNFYGGVPIAMSTDFNVNGSLPRASVATVYEQIFKDLLDAKDLVKENYVTTGRLRPNNATVTSLLARVYLYQKQWAKAEEAASEVIAQTKLYGVITDLTRIFEPNSREVIWQINSLSQGIETPDGWLFIPSSTSAVPTYNITQSLLDVFELNDGRRTSWVAKRTVAVSGQPKDFYFPNKYKLRNTGWTTTPLESYSMFRLAEQYLIRAEARAQQNKTDLAKEDLNVIRNRSGLGNTGANSHAGLLDAIYKEKQVEFFCEWGHRWFDLKRTERINTVMPGVAVTKGSIWNSTKQLLPIPLDQIRTNPFLTQNPGYN